MSDQVGNQNVGFLMMWLNYISDNLTKAEKKKEKQKISGPLLTACDDIRSEFAHCNISIRVRFLLPVF